MDWFRVTLALYRDCLSRGASSLRRNPVVPFLPAAYVLLLDLAGRLAGPRLGLLGGILLVVAEAALASSFFFLLESIVRTRKVSLEDWRNSFSAYLGDFLGVLFVFWLASRFLLPAIGALPQGQLWVAFLLLCAAIFLNALPEAVYLEHRGALGALGESFHFVLENWVEWFPLQLLFALGFELLRQFFLAGPWGPLGFVLSSVLLSYFFLARGFLFVELQGTTRRSRSFRYRARSEGV
ncbi:MAG: hypothetical protein KatS3mg076_0270 [Candidatus Binatia bacterium]|nr:MAG: hypothetical protein KatS3mg076_0270 [Candidatus Binatia bacterium]